LTTFLSIYMSGSTTLRQAFNDALEIRRLTAGLGKPQRQAIAAALPKELAAA